ncbi:MAG TPA: SRPBCC domain-containing protein [Trueperaceae bacterium]|nr:SRPBCC domain-containing protein [Trueperaceae bacterium]
MSVKVDPSGRRSVAAEIDVPGTPEEVWKAIASGPGISSWFVPTTVEGRVGGTTVSHFAPDGSMDSVAQISEWQPPHRFEAKTEEGPGTVATEWIVEARAGGVCTVRVVHSWFADGDDWDSQFEGHAHGWDSFFKLLRYYLEHFPGQESRLVTLAGQSSESVVDTFEGLMTPLGIEDGNVGGPVTPSPDAPPLAGEVLEAMASPYGFSVILRLDDPAPALAHWIGLPMGGPVHVSGRFYLYGPAGVAKEREVETAWGEWLSDRLAAQTAGAEA